MTSNISNSKKKKIMTPLYQQSSAFLNHSIEKSSIIDTCLHFLSSPPVTGFRINLPPRVPRTAILIVSSPCKFLNQNQHIHFHSSSLIAFFEGTKAILLTACQLVEVIENKGFESALIDLWSEEEDNDTFLHQHSSDNKSFSKDGNSNNENKLDDEDDNDQASQVLQIDFCAIVNTRNKLIRILKREAFILQ